MLQVIERSVYFLARLAAVSGGIVLIGLVFLTVISVGGRSLTFLGLAPVAGDFELVEIGMGFAIFSFLPWCHLQRAHASVDLLYHRFGAGTRRLLAIFSDALVLGIALLIAWRLWLGMLDKRAYGDTTYLLEIPLWWAYGAAMSGAAIFVIVSAWCLFETLAGAEQDG